MRHSIYIFVLLLIGTIAGSPAYGAGRSKFETDMLALIRAANETSGLESLKDIELSPRVWACKQELDGYLPYVAEEPNNPTGRLIVQATSVGPAAYAHATTLALKGMPGYTLRDSDKDKTIRIDPTREARKVILTKGGRFHRTVITLVFVAHKASATTITIETR